MSDGMIMDKVEAPLSVDRVLDLARFGARTRIKVSPRIYISATEEGRKYPSFKLCAGFSVVIGGKKNEFEKVYAKGHEVAPPKAAANGFVIANTRLHREVKRLQQAGVKCDVAPFILLDHLPGTDLCEFEPGKPYHLDEFAILAGIGKSVELSMATRTRRLDEKGGPVYELCALYTIYYMGKQYQIETFHGRFQEGADEKTIARVHEVALHRLYLEQRKLKRVGVEIKMDTLWKGEENFRPLHIAPAGTSNTYGMNNNDEVPLQSAHGK